MRPFRAPRLAVTSLFLAHGFLFGTWVARIPAVQDELELGAAAGALDIAMNAHGVEVERRYARPILSSFHAGWSFGGLVGAGVGALAAWAGVGLLPHFTGVAVVVGVSTLPAPPALLPAGAARREPPPRLARPPRQLLALAALAFCGLFAEGAAADWSAVYLAGPLDAGAGLAALGFAAFSVAMAGFRLLGDGLTTRWGPVALMRRGGLLAGAGLAAALVIGHPAAALVGFACMGAGLAAVVPVSFRAARSLAGVPAGAGIAALTTVGYTAFLVGPPVIGFAAEVAGLPLALGIVVVLLGMLAALAAEAEPARALGAPVPEPLP